MPSEIKTSSERQQWSAAMRGVVDRTGTKSIALLISAILAVAGVVMIGFGLRNDGSIDLKAAVVEGRLKTGSIGVLIIFMSTFIVLLCVLMRSRQSTLEIRPGCIKWSGVPNHIDQATIRDIARDMKTSRSEDTERAGA